MAGPKYIPPTRIDKTTDERLSSKPRDPFRTGEPFSDPWSSYTGQKIIPEAAKSTVPSKTPSAADITPGPIGTQFQQQETRIQAVEQALQQLQGSQQKFQETTDGKFAALEAQINQQNHDQIQAITTLHDSQRQMHDSLAQALQKQDSRISNAFDDLRQLFLSQQRGKKRPGDDQEDEPDM